MQFRSMLNHGFIAILTVSCAAILLVLAYATRPAATFGVVPLAITGELQQFYQPEHDQQTGELFRWSMPHAALNLPRPGDRTRLILGLASGQNAPVAVSIGSGTSVSRFVVASAPRRYQLLVQADPRATRLRLDLQSAQVPQTADDTRPRGIVLRELALYSDGRTPFGILLFGGATALVILASLQIAGLKGSYAAAVVTGSAALFAVALWLGAWQIWWLAEQVALFATVCLVALLIRHELRRFNIVRLDSAWHVLALCALVIPLRLVLVPMLDPIGDLSSFFLSWARWARSHGLDQFYGSGSDYPPLWPLALGRLGALADALNLRFTEPLPLPAALLLKCPAILADLALTLIVYWYALNWRTPRQAFGIAAVCALLPPFWIDSAWWGQIDVIPMLAIVLALLMFARQHGLWSWALFAIALLIKFQMIVFAPLFVLLVLRQHGLRWLAAGAAVATSIFALVCLPLVAAGQSNGLRDAYLSSVDRYPYVSMHAYNLWALLTRGRGIFDVSRSLPGIDDRTIWLAGLTYHQAGFLMLGLFTLAVCGLLWRRHDQEGANVAAILLALGFYMLPTQMHERYLQPVFPLLLLWWSRNRVACWPLLLLTVTGTLTLLRSFPLWPAVHTALTPLAVPMALATLNLAMLLWMGRYALRLWQHTAVAQSQRRTISRRPRSLHPRSRRASAL